MEILCSLTIMIGTYIFVEILKLIIRSKKFLNFVPLISGLTGLILAVVIFKLLPEISLYGDITTRMTNGFFNGLSATGINQINKQLKKLFNNK